MSAPAHRRLSGARSVLSLAAVVVLATLLAVGLAGAAGAQSDDTGWVVDSFDAVIDVAADGTMEVTEDISVDFANLERRGIFRVIPARYELSRDEERARVPDGVDPQQVRRAIDISAIEVSSTAPADTEITRPDRFGERNLRIRIGDPDVTVTGRQEYRIRYEVRGAANRFEGLDELTWNVTGHEWPVPIRRARVVVHGPPLARAACYQGPHGSTQPCDRRVPVRRHRPSRAAVGRRPFTRRRRAR